ncbi:MAG: hypothetical protein NTX65_03220 [Ignavibacteriales bacterium]|nr:hypothetical protein [Ignavibacteriales bacterium]
MINKANVAKPPKLTKSEMLWANLFQTKLKNSITVGGLITQLQSYPADVKIYFSGLDYSRMKQRGEFVQMEFGQQVYLNKRRKIVIEEIREGQS